MSNREQTSTTGRATLAIRTGLQEDSAMRPSPMETMRNCVGSCTRVPNEVCAALLDSLQVVPGGNTEPDACDARAVVIALRMATEGWRFCPCFAEGATPQHARVFGLVQTDFANRLAQNALLQSVVPVEKRSAA